MDTISDDPLSKAERAGIKLAIKGRIAAALTFLAFYAAIGQYPDILLGLGALALFVCLGLIHLWLIVVQREKAWHRFVFAGIDAGIICVLAMLAPLSTLGDLPQIFVFRIYTIAYLMVFLAMATLSLSPLLVLWTGCCQVAGIWIAFIAIVSDMDRTVTWGDVPTNPRQEDFFAVFFDPNFIGTGSRVVESICLIVSAAILALAVSRARNLVRTEARAQAAKANLARYVSPNLVEQLATAAEPLGAVRRQQAAILFVDVVGFTRFAERNEPEAVIDFLRDFHSRMADVVFKHEGTLDDYVGDEVMAVFGTPEPRTDDAARAYECAHAMRHAIARWNVERIANGEAAVEVGIGLHFGTVVAGGTGSADRLKFAVVGDTVNVASRLQAATRELGCAMVVSYVAMQAAQADSSSGDVQNVSLRGHAADIPVVAFGTMPSGAT